MTIGVAIMMKIKAFITGRPGQGIEKKPLAPQYPRRKKKRKKEKENRKTVTGKKDGALSQ